MFQNDNKQREDQAEHALVTQGQRRVNLVWEFTQAAVALILVLATAAAALRMAFYGQPGDQIPNILSVLVGTVVGAYFQRTNHQNIGGTGYKATDNAPYVGR